METNPNGRQRLFLLIFRGMLLAGVLVILSLSGGQILQANNSPSQTSTSTVTPDTNDALFPYAHCMRDNGIPDFPYPVEGGINLLGTGLDVNAPDFKAARDVCQSLLPRPAGGKGEKIVPGVSPWEKIVPGGDTMCADGSEFVYWVRPADPAKIVLFLEGGGACWDAAKCTFTSNESTYDWNITGGDDPVFKGGIFDFSNPENPFAGYSFVYVPYCTGDVHLGNITREYSPGLTVEHKGFANGSAALDYLTETYPNAGQVVVVGVSAGSVAAPVYSGLVSDAIPGAQITVFADSSGAYPDNPTHNKEILGMWGAFETMPDWEVNNGLKAEDWGFNRFWIQAGLHDPEIIMARFDYAYDAVQAKYMAMADLDAPDLLGSIDANESAIESAGVVQHSYTAPGNEHGVVNGEEFYMMEFNGVRLVDWVEELVTGAPLDDVR